MKLFIGFLFNNKSSSEVYAASARLFTKSNLFPFIVFKNKFFKSFYFGIS